MNLLGVLALIVNWLAPLVILLLVLKELLQKPVLGLVTTTFLSVVLRNVIVIRPESVVCRVGQGVEASRVLNFHDLFGILPEYFIKVLLLFGKALFYLSVELVEQLLLLQISKLLVFLLSLCA